MLKIVFYYTSSNTLGHATVVSSLIKAVKRRYKEKVRIMVLQEENERKLILPRHYARIKPIPRYPAIEHISQAENKVIFKKRWVYVKKELDEFKPNLVITEYLPFGRRFHKHELRCWLPYIKDRFRCKILCSCTYPHAQQHTEEFLRDFYDGVFFHFPRSFLNKSYSYLPAESKPILKKICLDFNSRISFTGFILDKEDIRNNPGATSDMPQEGFILVSRGGRLENNKVIVSSILLARKNPRLKFLISCGPFTGKDEFSKLLVLGKANPNVKLVKYIPPLKFETHLRRCALSINMSGYNTIARLLYFQKKTIMIPSANNEQEWLAQSVSKHLPCRVMKARDCDVSLLGQNMTALLNASRKVRRPAVKNWFMGAELTAELLARWLS